MYVFSAYIKSMSIITINVFLKYLESGISPDSLESKFTQLRSASLGGKIKNYQDKIRCYPMHCSQTPPFMGFLRQEYCSRLPFPSPRIWFFCNPMGCGLPGSSVLGKSLGVGCHFLLQGIFPTQGSNPGLLCWQADSATEPHTVTNLVRYRALARQFAHLTPLLVRTCMSRVSGTSKVTPGAMICYGDSQNSPSTCASFVWCLTHFSIKATLSFALLYEIGIICFVMWVNRINKFEGFLFYSFSF